jgi:integrase
MIENQVTQKKRNSSLKIKLTKKVITRQPFPTKGQTLIRDTEIPGFGLRVTPGAKTFILEKWIEGRCRRITIGAFGPMTVDNARADALKMTNEIIHGKDPAEEKIARRRGATFDDLIDRYMKEHATKRKKTAANDQLNINKHLIRWKNRKIDSIKRQDVLLLHSQIGEKHPTQANRIVALIRKMFNLAHFWGMTAQENPATGIQMFREKERDRFVQPRELPALMEAIGKEENIFVQAFFLLALFTGQRKGELLSMRWADLDFDRNIWRLPETKPGRPHLLPLPTPALNILERLPRVSGNEFVFPGRNGDHLVNVDKRWRQIRERAKLKDVHIHDLRRTLGSYLATRGDSLILIGKALGHSQVQTTAVYARLNLDPVRAALEANAQEMLLLTEKSTEEKA